MSINNLKLFSAKQGLLKRINCFKQQNSEENPLILLNNTNLANNTINNQQGNVLNSKATGINSLQPPTTALNYNEQQLNQNSDHLNEMYLNQINPDMPMPYLNSNNNNNYMPFNQMVNQIFIFKFFLLI